MPRSLVRASRNCASTAGVYFLRKVEICDSTAMTLMTPSFTQFYAPRQRVASEVLSISSFQTFEGQLPLRAASNSLCLSPDESEGRSLIQHGSALASYPGNEEARKP